MSVAELQTLWEHYTRVIDNIQDFPLFLLEIYVRL